MALETGVTYIDDLVATNPNETDLDTLDEADNHMRLIKTAVQGSFPSLGLAAVTSTAAELNILDGVTSFLDEDDMASDSATAIASQQSVKAYVNTKIGSLNTKSIDIGIWDMDATTAVNVNHGVTMSKIRSCQVMIRNDADTEWYQLGVDNGTTTGGYYSVQATQVRCLRHSSGAYDNTSYDDGAMNRGYIVLQYTD